MMMSTVEFVDVRPRVKLPSGEDSERFIHAAPLIRGNYLVMGGNIKLVSPNGETLVLATPVRAEDRIVIHFSFGTEERSIAHTLEIEDMAKIAKSLQAMVDMARLERRKD